MPDSVSSLESAVAVFASVNFLVIGLSHLLRPEQWMRFFGDLASKGSTGAFLNGLLSLGMGSVIVGFHQVWSWPQAVLSALGWLYLVKALVTFAAPGLALESMKRGARGNPARFRVAGAILLALGIFLAVRVVIAR